MTTSAPPRVTGALALAAIAVAAGAARGEPLVVRMGTVAPEGTAWARIAKGNARDLEAASDGQIRTRWYFGGIAGNEMEMAERIRRDQLDGIASGGMLCEALSPSMRVLRVVGLFQTREESAYVAGRLKPVFDEEFRKAGFINLGEVGIGPDLVFSREPIRSFDELKRTRTWVWDLDQVHRANWPLIGVNVVPKPIHEAYRAFERHEIDAFVAAPSAALAFQWSTEARYVSELRVSFLRTCVLLSTRVFDQLPLEQRQALLNMSARGLTQLEESGRQNDEQLLGGLFARQGLKFVPASEAFRGEFFAQARIARDHLPPSLVQPELLQRVLTLLADFRAEHVEAR